MDHTRTLAAGTEGDGLAAEIKRNGGKPDFKVLGQQYMADGDRVHIRDREMSESDLQAFEAQIKLASGSLI